MEAAVLLFDLPPGKRKEWRVAVVWVYLACRYWGVGAGDCGEGWCQAASAVVVQRVLGEEEEVGVIAECCDSRLHSLHRLSV